jgi:hypothetical protein
MNGNRFDTQAAATWQGKAGETDWWWQVQFPEPRHVGAILQINGDHPFALRNAARSYVWQVSEDGTVWSDLRGTDVNDERRAYRLHRLERVVRVRYLRLLVRAAHGTFPTLREVEVFADSAARVAFDPWAVVVSTTGDSSVPGAGIGHLQLAQSCEGWDALEGQNVWLGDFDESFLEIEPHPLCAFLSGNFIDWCQQNRTHWRGVQEVLRHRALPVWASCGGAQGLAILAETGAGRPWDCPQCRDARNPLLPIYTHIAGSQKRRCGDYSGCLFERGPHTIVPLAADPVFEGLPREFHAMQSHCGQIEWPPENWIQIATCGPDGKTKMQCWRMKDRYIYAAQFHIDMEGTPQSARQIMRNFLNLARNWGGYNPRGTPVPEPVPLTTTSALR